MGQGNVKCRRLSLCIIRSENKLLIAWSNRVVISTVIFGITVLYYFFGHVYISNIIYASRSSQLKSIETVLFPLVYSLDSECKPDLNDNASLERGKEFNRIFETGRWAQVASRSGDGSTLEGAFDWIKYLRTLFENYPIRSVADVPCGDTYWQFSLREMNTLQELYFGGDISTSVIKQNQRLYGSRHRNKLFQFWDLARCPISTYTFRNLTHEIKGNTFDLIMVRDAIQHMNIRNGLKVVRHAVLSGAKFFALSTYPPNGTESSAANTRSIKGKEPLPPIPAECAGKDYCIIGAIKDGDMHFNNINCPPFNFPLNKAILVQRSHVQFFKEKDEIHIYPIDDELKQIVQQYDKACP